MAFLTETSRNTGMFSALRDAALGLRDAFVQYTIFRRTYNELNALSSRELNDLGIARSMITRLAYEAAYGKSA